MPLPHWYSPESLPTLFVIFLSVVANFVAKQAILSVVRSLILRSRTNWDDVLVQRKVFTNISHLAPALVLYTLIPWRWKDMDCSLPFTSVWCSFT